MGTVCRGRLERVEHSRIRAPTGLEAEACHGRLPKFSNSVALRSGWQVQEYSSRPQHTVSRFCCQMSPGNKQRNLPTGSNQISNVSAQWTKCLSVHRLGPQSAGRCTPEAHAHVHTFDKVLLTQHSTLFPAGWRCVEWASSFPQITKP